MKIVNNIKTFLYDKEYFINIYDNKIHVFNYIDLEVLKEKEIILHMDKFKLQIIGQNLHVTKMAENEILINGQLDNLRLLK